MHYLHGCLPLKIAKPWQFVALATFPEKVNKNQVAVVPCVAANWNILKRQRISRTDTPDTSQFLHLAHAYRIES